MFPTPHHPRQRFTLLTVAVAFAMASTGCSSDLSSLESADAYVEQSAGAGKDSGYDTGGGAPTVAPQFYGVSGTFELTADEIDPILSTFDMGWFDIIGDPICDGPRGLLTATATVLDDTDVPAFGWWALTLDMSSCGSFGPDALELGIGAWDPQLAPAAEAAGLNGAGLYTTYLRHQGGPVFAFGVAGTAELFNEVTLPQTEGPLPDGAYQVRALHLLPMPP